jgi:hypothetical protein
MAMTNPNLYTCLLENCYAAKSSKFSPEAQAGSHWSLLKQPQDAPLTIMPTTKNNQSIKSKLGKVNQKTKNNTFKRH